MTLTGIFKNILLILVSILIWSTKITFMQTIGYAVALAGLTYYSLGYEQLARVFQVSAAWAAGMWGPTSGRGRSSTSLAARRCIMITALLFCGLFIFVAALGAYDPRAKEVFKLPSWFGTE